MELLQGLITRAIAKRTEEEHKEKLALFEMFQNLTLHLLEGQGEDYGGSKTLLLSKVQVEESKKTILEGFLA